MVSLRELVPGARLKLKSGKIVEVVENPRDGTWIIARLAGQRDAPSDLVHADDVVEQVP
jgi:hypothetical protein